MYSWIQTRIFFSKIFWLIVQRMTRKEITLIRSLHGNVARRRGILHLPSGFYTDRIFTFTFNPFMSSKQTQTRSSKQSQLQCLESSWAAICLAQWHICYRYWGRRSTVHLLPPAHIFCRSLIASLSSSSRLPQLITGGKFDVNFHWTQFNRSEFNCSDGKVVHA